MSAWLIDTSALVRLASSRDPSRWVSRVERGLVRISTVTRLEAGFSARSSDDFVQILDHPPIGIMPIEYLTPRAEDRASEVQRALAHSGHHRAPSVPDLLVAAIAETVGLIVLHLDKDFDLIASVTGQPVERLALA